MAHIITRIQRVSPELAQSLGKLGAATIHEAYGRRGVVDPAIRPAVQGVGICGPAFTVECAPHDNLMLHKALQRAEPGDIIVAVTGGHTWAGYWGGLMTVSALARELGGLAIEGCIRDSEEISALGFPVFCRGFCMRGTSKSLPGLVNHPVIFGGVLIKPGDLVVGDQDGMVAVARSDCEEVLEKGLKRVEAEKTKAAKLGSGVTSVELNSLDAVFDRLGLVEE